MLHWIEHWKTGRFKKNKKTYKKMGNISLSSTKLDNLASFVDWIKGKSPLLGDKRAIFFLFLWVVFSIDCYKDEQSPWKCTHVTQPTTFRFSFLVKHVQWVDIRTTTLNSRSKSLAKFATKLKVVYLSLSNFKNKEN